MAVTVLHVEPHDDTRDLLACMLAPFAIEVVGAADGETAYELAARLVPDVIVAELIGPLLDGFEFARKVRATRALARVPLVAWTGRADIASHGAALAAGFDRIVVKTHDFGITNAVLILAGVTPPTV